MGRACSGDNTVGKGTLKRDETRRIKGRSLEESVQQYGVKQERSRSDGKKNREERDRALALSQCKRAELGLQTAGEGKEES